MHPIIASTAMDYEKARINMIEQQIRPWNVLATRTLNALGEIRREDFVPDRYRRLSFVDTRIPLGDDQVMLEPKVSARMIEALELEPEHRVLEIGTGSGYTAALMASLGAEVTSLEIRPQLSGQAKRNLAMAGIENVALHCADCFRFCETRNAGEPFDRVLVTGSVPLIGSIFLDRIHARGRLVGIEGNDPAMQVVMIQGNGQKTSLFETSVPRLENVHEQAIFDF